MITFPKIEDKTKEFSGDNTNSIINNADMLIHKQTFLVVLAYSTIISEEFIIYIMIIYYDNILFILLYCYII
jgi:hypothetical protein